MYLDLYDLPIQVDSRPILITKDVREFYGTYLVSMELSLTVTGGLLYRQQTNDILVGLPHLRWFDEGSWITFQMSYRYRSHSYYQAYGLDLAGLPLKQVTYKNGERTMIASTSHFGKGLTIPWAAEDYFLYTDFVAIRSGTYGYSELRAPAFDQFLGDINAHSDFFITGNGELQSIPAQSDYETGITAFEQELVRYRSLLDPIIEQPSVSN